MEAREFDIVVAGELNADLVLSGDVTPVFGQVEKLIDDASLVLGSSSAIFACGAARLGLRVAFIGTVGDDALGRFCIEQLQARGVHTQGVIIRPDLKTGLSVIFNKTHDRAILTYSGSIRELRIADIDLALVQRARHLHIGSYYMLDLLRPDVPALFDAAHVAGLTISIDTNYDPTEQWQGGIHDALCKADVFLPNDTELTAIARQNDVESALTTMRDIVPLTAVKLGKAGAKAQRGDDVFTAGSISVDVVDTVGAGDSFDAGFIYGHLAGWDVTKSLRMGCVCGALSTRAAGGTAAQATLDEAMRVQSAEC
jgi:sugar/nucleoside kinase (ribokinase family)